MSMRRMCLVALALAGLGCGAATSLQAQQGPVAKPQSRPAPGQAKAGPQGKDASRSDGGDAALRGRVEQLEEQLSDMQVTMGTLESLGRGAGGSVPLRGAPAGGGGVDQARIDSLETQIRALSSQLEQLAAQVRQLSGTRRGELAPPAAPGPFAAAPGNDGGFEREAPQARGQGNGAVPGFGSTTVTIGERGDPIGRMLGSEQPQAASASPSLPPQAASAGNPRELYETAYGYLLQQDYGAAEVAFEEFLRRYPQDRLSADAQYWLGETLYVQRRYKPAGQAFLAVIERHKQSAKVPNSLLKLAQSLDQLGQKDCGIFSELEGRYPNAPADVRVKARALKQKQGC